MILMKNMFTIFCAPAARTFMFFHGIFFTVIRLGSLGLWKFDKKIEMKIRNWAQFEKLLRHELKKKEDTQANLPIFSVVNLIVQEKQLGY